MDMLTWIQGHSTGIDSIDEQHQKIFILMNKMQKEFQTGDKPGLLDVYYNELFECIRTHFGTEESLLTLHVYPNYEEHRIQHLKFLNRIEQNLETIRDKQKAEGAINFISQWWHEHIVNDDMKYAKYFSGHQGQ
jgi:hemerythrin